MSFTDTVNIAYCNVNGLDDICFDHLISTIHTSKYHIVVATETWYMNRNKYQNHSFFYAESHYPTTPSLNRRQDGGLLMLISPPLKTKITILYISQYSLKIKINDSNQILLFTYLPPSLSDVLITQELENVGNVDTVVGDLNIRLGALSGDKIRNATSRRSVLLNYTSQYHMSYIRNSNQSIISRTDHIFVKDRSSLIWTYDKPLFNTDHYVMNISLKISPIILQSFQPSCKRYDFKPLKRNAKFAYEFVYLYNRDHASNVLIEAETALSSCCHAMILPNTTDTQTIIDYTYDYLIDSIIQLLDNSLFQYDAHEVKSRRDNLMSSSFLPSDNNDIIRAFKRSQRSNAANNPILSRDSARSPLDECHEHYTQLFTSSESPPTIQRQNDTTFGLRFDEDLVASQILKYDSSKSCGPDLIHTVVWKALIQSKAFLRSLAILFQIFASTSLVPSSWSQCNLHLLQKDPNEPFANKTRPISLSNILRRIFEKITLQLWTEDNNEWQRLNDAQAGFRHGFSTLSHLILSDELSRRGTKYSIFLDIMGAFDNVSWTKLNNLLIQRNCPPTHRNLILSLICKPATLFLTVNQSEKTTIRTMKGVFQGGCISAFIFTLYIDPLADILNASSLPHQPLSLFFADDIQIKAKSEIEAQHALNLCTQYGNEYSMKWNLKKCAVVSEYNTEFSLSNQLIPAAEDYKYLGVYHRYNRLDLQKTFNVSMEKQSRMITALTDNTWHPRTRLIIYKTFMRPVTEYSGVLTYIWASKSFLRNDILTSMANQHKMALKWIFQRQYYLKIFDYLSGLGPWDFRMNCLTAGLNRSLLKMNASNPLVNARSHFLLSGSSHFILQDCFKSKYWLQYEKDKSNHSGSALSWETWRLNKLRATVHHESRSSALISYLGPYNSKSIKDFLNVSIDSFNIMFTWRCNRALLSASCVCNVRFNRSHVDCCLMNNPEYETILESSEYSQYHASISSSSAPHFSVLDYLLNQSRFEEFISLYRYMSDVLA